MQTSSWHNFSAAGTVSAMWYGDDERGRVERSWLRYAGVGVQYGMTILFVSLLGIWRAALHSDRPPTRVP